MCQIANHGLIVANTWALQVVANGGAVPSTQSITALANFVTTLDKAGLWSKMLDFSFFAPDSLIAALTPAKVTYGLKLWINHNFAPTDITVNGLTPDGATKYLDTGANINSAPPFTGQSPAIFPGFSVYVFNTNGIDGSQCEMSWTKDKLAFYSSFGGTAFLDCYNTGAGRVSAANALWAGFVSGNRVNSATSALYRANSIVPFQLLGSNNANNTTQPAADTTIFVFANNDGTGNVFAGNNSRKTLSFAALHYGLNATDCQNLFNAVQALRVALGGGFV